MDLELERERRADVRESRIFDQFRDYLDTTCSDLKDAALVRERAARLGLQLKHSEEKAAAAAAAAAERSRVADDVIHPVSGTSIQPTQPIHSIVALSDALPAVSHVSGTNMLENYFSTKNKFSASVSASTADNTVHADSETHDVEVVEPHHVTGVPNPKCFWLHSC